MINNIQAVKPGATLADPIGRIHRVKQVFVPKNHPELYELIPSRLRNETRKVVVFDDGVMRLADLKSRYSLVA